MIRPKLIIILLMTQNLKNKLLKKKHTSIDSKQKLSHKNSLPVTKNSNMSFNIHNDTKYNK